jgi:predicted transcriptional regulator
MTVKELAQKAISYLPEEATFDDIQYQHCVLECIEQGEKDITEGKTLTEQDVRNGLEAWRLSALSMHEDFLITT